MSEGELSLEPTEARRGIGKLVVLSASPPDIRFIRLPNLELPPPCVLSLLIDFFARRTARSPSSSSTGSCDARDGEGEGEGEDEGEGEGEGEGRGPRDEKVADEG